MKLYVGNLIYNMTEAELRSEERRVGKECRYRGSPYHEKKKRNECGREER